MYKLKKEINMKKIIISLFAMTIMCLPVSAAYNAEGRVPTVGKNILTKNSLPTTTTFKVVEGSVNNDSVATTNIINISKADLTYAGNDNEVAAVISNEIGHIINGHAAKNKFRDIAKAAITSNLGADNIISTASNSDYVANKNSLSDNKEADVTGVDLMIKAGYNPLAMIVVITKMPGSTLETIQGKPSNSERAMNVFDYLTYNYPSKIKSGYNCQEYKRFLAYAEPIVKDRTSNKKKLAKFNKEQEKNKVERAKQIAKYKATGGLTGWDASYTILKTLSESSEN